MAPNEQARKNHDELFPGHVSTLAVTDPELVETFDNFAFDEVHWISPRAQRAEGHRRGSPARKPNQRRDLAPRPVSYTHLTLPTIYSV